jgi:arabinofuranosyltransferase
LPIVVPALAVAILGIHRRWSAEDAFITFRVVRHIIAGNGPVFNAGERVEASTSTLWTFLLAGLSYFSPSQLEWIATVTGILFATSGVILLARFSLLLAADELSDSISQARAGTGKIFFAPFGLLVPIALPAFWDYTTSGLESGLCVGWLGVCAVALARQRLKQSLQVPTAVLLGLGPLVRPEFALYSGVFLLTLFFIAGSQWRDLPRLLLAAALLPLLYQLFRMGYYAALVPNTALAKEASRILLERGLPYFWDLFGAYWLLVPLLLVCVGVGKICLQNRDSRTRALIFALPVGGLINLAYIISIGGDYMHGRLMLPALVAIVAPVAVWRITIPQRGSRWLTQWPGIAAVGVILCWAIAVGLFVRAQPQGENVFRFVDERFHMVAMSREPHPVSIDDYKQSASYIVARQMTADFGAGKDIVVLNADSQQRILAGKPDVGRVAIISFIGVAGYALPLDVHIVDLLSLADPIGSRIALYKPGFAAGHEKIQPIPWALARFAAPSDDESAQVREARSRLECSGTQQLLDAIQQPLTLERFLKNIGLAPSLTSLRLGVPPDLFSC